MSSDVEMPVLRLLVNMQATGMLVDQTKARELRQFVAAQLKNLKPVTYEKKQEIKELKVVEKVHNELTHQ
jgi:DNA polymerase I-like protein with 3'-5' exonuclease and polymerase domains